MSYHHQLSLCTLQLTRLVLANGAVKLIVLFDVCDIAVGLVIVTHGFSVSTLIVWKGACE